MTDDELDAIERRAKDAWAEVQCSAPGSRGNPRDNLAADVLRDVDSLVAELRRLRKIFDDAGQGEHNVLALIEHYQDEAIRLHDVEAAARELVSWDWLDRLDDSTHSADVKADVAKLTSDCTTRRKRSTRYTKRKTLVTGCRNDPPL